MFQKKTDFKKIKLLSIFFLIALICNNFSVFENIYFISKNTYEERNIINYGYCAKEGYGFASKIKKKFLKNKNIKTYNYGNYPNIDGVFFNPKLDYSEEYFIIINSNLDQIKKKYKDFDILAQNKNNCFFIKVKND